MIGGVEARLVITAVRLEKRPVAEVVAAYRVSRAWVYKLLARYDAEGEAAFEPRSKRPRSSHRHTPTRRRPGPGPAQDPDRARSDSPVFPLGSRSVGIEGVLRGDADRPTDLLLAGVDDALDVLFDVSRAQPDLA